MARLISELLTKAIESENDTTEAGPFTWVRLVAADLKPRGNLVPDAHLVALMRSTAYRRSGATTARPARPPATGANFGASR